MYPDKQLPYLVNSGHLTFAGMRGSLARMQSEGWQFSVQMDSSLLHGSRRLYLACQRSMGRLQMLAATANDIYESFLRGRDPIHGGAEMEFHAVQVASNIEVIRTHIQGSVKFGAFDAADMFPAQLDATSIIHLGSLAFFKPIQAPQEIYIPEKEIWTVEKHLEAILKDQAPKQAELRERHLKEQRKKELNQGCESRAVAQLIAV